MHVYCINLERRQDRRGRVAQEFEREDIGPIEFFPATDGRVEAPKGIYISPAEYGCASSHVRIWRDIVTQGYEQALVFEDDVTLLHNFKTKLQTILSEATRVPEWDMIFLGHITPIYRSMVSENLVEAQPLGTHSYLINLECARKLCNFDPKFMKVGIDFQLNRFPLKILCTRELITSQGDMASEMGFLSLKSMVDGDIGLERTMDFGFVVRLGMQHLKIFIVLAVALLVLKLTQSSRA